METNIKENSSISNRIKNILKALKLLKQWFLNFFAPGPLKVKKKKISTNH